MVFAADKGFLKEIAVEKIGDFETALLSYMNSEHKDLMDAINVNGDYNDDIEIKKFLENNGEVKMIA